MLPQVPRSQEAGVLKTDGGTFLEIRMCPKNGRLHVLEKWEIFKEMGRWEGEKCDPHSLKAYCIENSTRFMCFSAVSSEKYGSSRTFMKNGRLHVLKTMNVFFLRRKNEFNRTVSHESGIPVYPPYTVSVDDCLRLPTPPTQALSRHVQSQVEACHPEASTGVPRS